MSAITVMATDVIASLKSGVLLTGTVRSHTTAGSSNIAWIAIELPVVGEREVLVKDEQNLQLGQQVVIQCVPNPLKPERYMFRIVEVLMPMPAAAAGALAPRPKIRCAGRVNRLVRRRIASKN